MALFQRTYDGGLTSPGARLVIGRSGGCDLVIDDPRVSGEHAVLTHRHGQWVLRDLGSRNGTSVDGRGLSAGDAAEIERGSKICIGGRDIMLECLDAAPPRAYALSPSGTQHASQRDLLALPSDEDPKVTIYRGDGDVWYSESAEATEVIDRGAIIEVDGETYTVIVPPVSRELASTMQSREPATITLDAVRLTFEVSAAEEIVTLIVQTGRAHDVIAPRTSNHLLLLLARARMRDADVTPEAEAGWLYTDQLAGMLAVNVEHLNVLVYRARAVLADVGVIDAPKLVERRPATRQLRIGMPPARLRL